MILALSLLIYSQFEVSIREDSLLAQHVQPYLADALLDLGISPESLFPGAEPPTPPEETVAGETARVLRVIDGDTIEVRLGDGEIISVRYIGINTPERNEPCYEESSRANRDLVGGQTVTLVKDVSEVDRYGRLLRYIYAGDTFVNRELVAQGFAEAVLYQPDEHHFQEFARLEQEAAGDNLGCHRSGIFQDESSQR